MTPDQEPIPPDSLPPGWCPVEQGDERVAYRRFEPPVELIAALTEADRSHPVLGLGRCWELRYRHSIGDLPVTERIGRVSTRNAAIEGLLKCMHRIHDRIERPADPVEVHATLDGIRLTDLVPDLCWGNVRQG